MPRRFWSFTPGRPEGPAPGKDDQRPSSRDSGITLPGGRGTFSLHCARRRTEREGDFQRKSTGPLPVWENATSTPGNIKIAETESRFNASWHTLRKVCPSGPKRRQKDLFRRAAGGPETGFVATHTSFTSRRISVPASSFETGQSRFADSAKH